MVDIKKDFGDSFNLLLRQKKIIIPMFLAVTIPMILIFLFLNLSGLSPLLKELMFISAEFDKQKTDYLLNTQNVGKENYTWDLFNYLGKDSRSSNYDDQLAVYLGRRGYDWSRYLRLVNIKNIILIVLFIIIGGFCSFYFSCMSYVLIALTFKKKAFKKDKIDTSNLIKLTNKFLLKFFSLKLLSMLIFISPLLITIPLIIFLFFLNKVLGLLSILLSIFLFLAYLIFMNLRLIFVEPPIFLEEKSPVESIKHSFNLTKGHLKKVLIVWLMIVGISIFINSFIGKPFYDTYFNILFESSIIRILINFMLFASFLVLESFVFTFKNIFLFYTYIDFRGIISATFKKEKEEVAK